MSIAAQCLPINHVRRAALLVARTAARAYTAGRTTDALGAVCHALHRRNLSTSVCYWNADSDTPRQVAAGSVRLLEVISTFERTSYLSIKAPAIKFDEYLIDAIVERCHRSHIPLHFDSLAPEHAPAILRMIERICDRNVPLSLSVPARWRRSVSDAKRATELGVRVRIVKGQWRDVGNSDIDPRRGFLTLIDELAGRPSPVAVATHDRDLAATAVDRLLASGSRCEVEAMYGFPIRRLRDIAQRTGNPIRVYVPYGHAWLPYRLRSASENPRVLVWLVRDLVRGL